MSSLAESVSSANVRWYERSIRRYYADEEDERPESGDDDAQLSLRVGVRRRDTDEPSSDTAVIVRIAITDISDTISFGLDCAVKFTFSDDAPIDDQSAVGAFVTNDGLPFVLGFIRSGLLDACRSVGVGGVILPFDVEQRLVEQLDGIAG